jgi:hypothetical protein
VVGYVDSCPHAGWPLAGPNGRFLTRENDLILCAGHAALFRIEDGAMVAGPCSERLADPLAGSDRGFGYRCRLEPRLNPFGLGFRPTANGEAAPWPTGPIANFDAELTDAEDARGLGDKLRSFAKVNPRFAPELARTMLARRDPCRG